MRARTIVSLLVAGMLAASPAYARGGHRTAYGGAIVAAAAASWGLLAGGLVLRYDTAPNAPTLESFKRDGSASEALLAVGGALQIAVLIFALIGGLSGLADAERAPTATTDRRTVSFGATGNGLAVRF